MTFFGIEFVPFNEPLHRRFETLAAGAWFVTTIFLGYISVAFCLYLLLTSYWWITILYTFWIYLDRHTCETGGRTSKWIRNWAWWRYMKDYFTAELVLDPDFKPDGNKNYLFCCFPHGVLPAGPFCNIASEGSQFHLLYPYFKVKSPALRQFFYLPIVREIGLGIGGISVSFNSLHYILSKPEGGYIVNLFPGGAEEAFYAFPGRYKFVVKKRKGFIKVALQTGASIVPVITFGDIDLFDQIQGSSIRKCQKVIKHWFGFTPVIFIGRGLFQYSFGLIPRRVPITTVVGRAINVKRVEVPTDKEIGKLHQIFVQELVNLFKKYKYRYLKNPNEITLELE